MLQSLTDIEKNLATVHLPPLILLGLLLEPVPPPPAMAEAAINR